MTSLVPDQLGLGALVASSDSVGRAYVLLALRLSPHPLGLLPDPMPAAWDDWCARAEALLVAANGGGWSADATQAALEAASAATVLALVDAVPVGVPDDAATVAAWRPRLAGDGVVVRTVGLPGDADFDRLIAAEAVA